MKIVTLIQMIADLIRLDRERNQVLDVDRHYTVVFKHHDLRFRTIGAELNHTTKEMVIMLLPDGND